MAIDRFPYTPSNFITQVIQVLQGMKEERQEAALTSGLDLWEMDGCPLLLGEVHG